jgi:hypothetical protein
MEFLPYLIVLVIVAANSVAAYIINRKRVALDLATDDGQKKTKATVWSSPYLLPTR